jgi:hypothetical protein
MSKAEARVEDLLSEVLPGESWLLKFENDEVWQEHVFLFPLKPKAWMVLTADLERRPVDFRPGKGVEDAGEYGVGGGPPAHCKRKTRYEFDPDDYPADEELKKLFVKSHQQAIKMVGKAKIIAPAVVVNADGNRVDADEFFEDGCPWKPATGWPVEDKIVAADEEDDNDEEDAVLEETSAKPGKRARPDPGRRAASLPVEDAKKSSRRSA